MVAAAKIVLLGVGALTFILAGTGIEKGDETDDGLKLLLLGIGTVTVGLGGFL